MKRYSMVLVPLILIGVGLACQIPGLASGPAPTVPVVKNIPVTVAAPVAVFPTLAAPVQLPPTAVVVPPQPTLVPTLIIPTQIVQQPPVVPIVPQVVAPTVPPPTVPSPCQNPNVAITSPVMDSTVTGLIEIRGTATRPDLEYWKVEYRPDYSTAFIELGRSDKGATDAVLARLSTKTIPNGPYWLQLAAVAKDGNFGTPCTIRINVAN